MARNLFARARISFVVPLDIVSVFDQLSHPDTAVKFMGDHRRVAGVKSYELLDSDWNKVGSRRRIEMNNGTRLIETIKSIEHPSHFIYHLAEFGDPNQNKKSTIKSGYSQCHFRKNKDGSTTVQWRFALQPHKPILLPATWIYMKTSHRNFMKASVKKMRRSL